MLSGSGGTGSVSVSIWCSLYYFCSAAVTMHCFSHTWEKRDSLYKYKQRLPILAASGVGEVIIVTEFCLQFRLV